MARVSKILGCTLVSALLASAIAGPATAAQPDTQTLTFITDSGWAVPPGVSSIEVELRGAPGGSVPACPGERALGASVKATIKVTPGSVLHFRIGGPGGNPQNTKGGVGGVNGGGAGGDGITGLGGSGGGGATDIRLGNTGIQDRILIAAGGGGYGVVDPTSLGTDAQCHPWGPYGGAAGTLWGQGGSNTVSPSGRDGGGGRLDTAAGPRGGFGGQAGDGAGAGQAGDLGVGGKGGSGQIGGGGGGGGYYGGGGGGGCLIGDGDKCPGRVSGGGGGGSSDSTGPGPGGMIKILSSALHDDVNGSATITWGGTEPPEETCQNPQDRHFTTLDAVTRLNVAFAPDPHLGTLHLGMTWCMTDQGPKILTRPQAASDPHGWWVGTDNWLLLGALEAFAGVTVEPPAEPTIVHGKVTANISTSLHANLNAADALANAIPVGKLFKPVKKVLKKYTKKLNPVTKRLKQQQKKVAAANKRAQKAGEQVRKARANVTQLRGFLADAEAELRSAKTRSERTATKKRIASLKKSAEAAKRAERTFSIDYQRSLSSLRAVKAQESKVIKQVDQVLKDVRKAVAKVTDFKQAIASALNKAADNVRPDWAREVVKHLVSRLMAYVDQALANLKSYVKNLSVRTVGNALTSGSSTSGLLSQLKSSYERILASISTIGVPVWDGNYTVSLDQSGNAFVADNSVSRFIFTVESENTLKTT